MSAKTHAQAWLLVLASSVMVIRAGLTMTTTTKYLKDLMAIRLPRRVTPKPCPGIVLCGLRRRPRVASMIHKVASTSKGATKFRISSLMATQQLAAYKSASNCAANTVVLRLSMTNLLVVAS
jgi:hypothetical protein